VRRWLDLVSRPCQDRAHASRGQMEARGRKSTGHGEHGLGRACRDCDLRICCALATAVTVSEGAQVILVKSIASLLGKFLMVTPFRCAEVSLEMSEPLEDPISVSAPLPVTVWPVPPAWIVSAPLLPTAVMDCISFSISVLAASSFTLLTLVAAVRAMVPAVVISGVLLVPRRPEYRLDIERGQLGDEGPSSGTRIRSDNPATHPHSLTRRPLTQCVLWMDRWYHPPKASIDD
jgi:hypothetical protein